MGTIDTTRSDLSKIVLVACDQAYDASVQPTAQLEPFPDSGAPGEPDPVDRAMPQEWNNLGLSQWTVLDRKNDVSTGFGATIYQKTNQDGTTDYIVAMQGTRGPNIQDWGGNLIYGWDKWGDPISGNGPALINQLVALSTAPNAGKIHFAGQSLGGALAEYALYDYAIAQGANFDPTKVTLTTFNGLGSIEALQINRTGPSGFNNNVGLFTNVDTAHFYITNDLVSRLGGGHLNGFENEYELRFMRTDDAGNVLRRPDLSPIAGDFIYAHRIESGFYHGFYQANQGGYLGDAVINGFPRDFTEAVARDVSILNIQNLAHAGTYVVWLSNKDGALPTDTEAYARMVAALLIGMASGPRDEVQTLVDAAVTNLYEANVWIKTKEQRDEAKLFFQDFLPLLAQSPAGQTGQIAARMIALATEIGGQSNTVEVPAGFEAEYLSLVTGANTEGATLAFDPVQAASETNDFFSQAAGRIKADALYVGGGALAIIAGILAIPNISQATLSASISSVLQASATHAGDALVATREMLSATARSLQQEFNDRVDEFANAMAIVSEALKDASDWASQFASNPQVFVDQIAAYLSDGLSHVTRAISNGYDDLTLKFTDAFEWGATVTRSFLNAWVTEFTELAGSASDRVRSAINEALDVLKSSGQTIQIAPSHPQNPFDAVGYDPDTAPVPSVEVEEGAGHFFTVYLAYDAPEGGQRVKVKLQGDNVDKFRVLAGEELAVVDGEFTLTVQENTREATFVLINDEDVDADTAITVSATLIDAQGTTTHQTHLEVNLALDAQVEAVTTTDNLILGDQDPESFEDTLSGTAGNDRILGLSMNDKLSGNAGSDVLEGGDATNVMEGGAGNDDLFAADAFDLATLTSYEGYGGDVGTNTRGDWLNGQRGDDSLVGSDSDDVLTGGGGRDLMLGGAGTDRLMGDNDWTAADFEWTHQPVSNPFDELTGLVVINEPYTADGAADIIYGGAGDDRIDGQLGDDVLYGESGNDLVAGWEGDDVLLGGSGDDRLTGEFYGDLPPEVFGADYLDGEDGNDELYGEGGADVLFGGAGDDRLFGYTDWSVATTPQYDGADHIEGEGGRDYIHGQTGDDFLDGGADDDTVYGDAGADLIYGGAGNDTLLGDNSAIPTAENGNDSIDGGDGDDLIIGGGGSDTLLGGLGIDQLQGGSGDDDLDGGDGADVLFGDAGDAVAGTQGSDVIEGGAGNDQIVGGGGVDFLSGGDGDDLLFGDGDDISVADQAADLLSGGAGSDNLRGYGGDDYLFGDGEDDTLWGEAGADYLDGGTGDDLLFGDAEATAVADQAGDVLVGGEGNDQLVGYGGADTLDGGAGNDTLFGDEGSDTYTFARGDGQDLIYDEDTTGSIDVVEFAADITPEDVTATRGSFHVNDLVLTIRGSSDELTIANQFSTNTAFRVEEIRFANGIVWTPSSTPMLVRGTSANNTLNGTSAADVFEGLAGNDTLQGGAGNDTYRFFRGDGADTITDFDSTVGNLDKVLYAADILPSDIQASRSGANLLLRLTGTTDQVTITNYFQNDGATGYSVEQIKFTATGTVWDVNAVKAGVLTGTSGADAIMGYATDDNLAGLGGNDTLTGNAGNDILNGGTGNDVLQGGAGNDTYLISRGDGQDTVTDVDATVGNVDRIQYADILSSVVLATRSGNNLVLKLTGTTDQVIVTNYFENDGVTPSSLERIEFLVDGTFWDVNTVKALALTGTSGNDTITGYATADTLAGLAGNDTLTGNAGNDTLDGGTGNDVMQGGAGNDTYRIARGDGQDTITDSDSTVGNIDRVLYAADILPSDVRATRSGSNLVLQIMGTSDYVAVGNYFQNDGATPFLVEQIEFQTDGTIWDVNTVKSIVIAPTSGDDGITGYATDDTLNGLGGNDVIRGAGGNDTLDGGTGNDTLYGEGGSDTYLFGRESGQETIVNADFDTTGTTDVLLFAADILPSQVAVTRSVNDLVLSVSGSPDQVQIRNYFLGGTALVEQITFADGTVWTEATIANLFPLNGTSGNDTLQGTGLSESISGLAGSDTVRGSAGNDTIDGGTGGDDLYGDSGNDILISGGADKVSDDLFGGDGDDVLIGESYLDHLYGEAGNDILRGNGSSKDIIWLEDEVGKNAFIGGAEVDDIWSGDQNDLVIGGPGNDRIDSDRDRDGLRGRDLILFNKTDGKDSHNDLGLGSTVSIGGGTLYSNLGLTTDGVFLTLKAGNNQIALDWYGQPDIGIPANRAVSTLQIVIEGTRDYKPTSANPMNNQKIQVFDFLGLVAAFDAARAAGQNFNVANNLANFRLWGSDTDAIGGAIAYQYARTGSVSALTYDQMRAVISAPEFGVSAQPITASSAMSVEASTATESTDTTVLTAAMSLDAEVLDASAGDVPEDGSAVHEVTNGKPADPSGVLHPATHDRPEFLTAPLPAPVPLPSESRAQHSEVAGISVTFSAGPEQGGGRQKSPPATLDDAMNERGGIAIQGAGDTVRQSAVPLAKSGDSQEAAAGPVVDLFARMEEPPRFHFEALAEYFEEEANRRNPILTSEQIAARWARVRAYTNELGADAGADDLGTVQGSDLLLGLGAGSLDDGSWGAPVRAAIGLKDSAAANLRQLEGIRGAMSVLG